MFGRRSAEEKQYDELMDVVEATAAEADRAIPLFDYAIAHLPNIDEEGEIRRARDILVESSKQLRKRLSPAIGPETIRGFKKIFRRIYDALDAHEDILIRSKLLKDAHAFEVAGLVDKHRLSAEGLRQHFKIHDEFMAVTGLKEYDPITKEMKAHEIARLTAVMVGQVYSTSAGQGGVLPVMEGMGLLSGPANQQRALPSPKVQMVNDDPDTGKSFTPHGTYLKHPVEDLDDE